MKQQQQQQHSIDLAKVFPEIQKGKLESSHDFITQIWIALSKEEGRPADKVFRKGVNDDKIENKNALASQFPTTPSVIPPHQHKLYTQQSRTSPIRSPPVTTTPVSGSDFQPRLLPSCDWCGRQMPSEKLTGHIYAEHHDEYQRFQQLKNDMQQIREKQVNIPVIPSGSTIPFAWGEIIQQIVLPAIETQETYNRRIDVVESLQNIIHSNYAFNNAHVYLFGSSVTGLAVRDSDTDVALVLYNGQDTSMPLSISLSEEKNWIENLYNHFVSKHPNLFQSGIDQFGNEAGLRKILRTRVPILGNAPYNSQDENLDTVASSLVVKYHSKNSLEEAKSELILNNFSLTNTSLALHESQITITFPKESETVRFLSISPNASILNTNKPPGVFCSRWDLSVRAYGVRNSQLLRAYLKEPYLRLTAAAVKVWSKKVKINDPRVGLLSSYAIALMFVHYLIQTKRVDFIDPNSVKLNEIPRLPSYIPKITFNNKEEKRKITRLVGETFIGFMRFFAFEFDWDNDVATLCSPHYISKIDRGWVKENAICIDRGNSVRYFLCIEDPYELADPAPWGAPQAGMLNVARKITEERALQIHQKIVKTYNSLLDNSMDADLIF